MAPGHEFLEFVKDLVAPLGPIVSRRMFSGAGIYCDGVIFALLLRDVLYFKVDDGNRRDYEAEGLSPFSYQAKGRTIEINAYWRVPERLFRYPQEVAARARGRRGAGGRVPGRG